MAEVKRALKSLKNKKASGFDNIPQKHGRKKEQFRPRSSTHFLIRSGMRRTSLKTGRWAYWLNFSRKEICFCVRLERYYALDSCPARVFVRSL